MLLITVVLNSCHLGSQVKRLMLGNGPFFCLKEIFSRNTVYGIFPQAVLGVLPGAPVLLSSSWGFLEGQGGPFPCWGRGVQRRAWRSQSLFCVQALPWALPVAPRWISTAGSGVCGSCPRGCGEQAEAWWGSHLPRICWPVETIYIRGPDSRGGKREEGVHFWIKFLPLMPKYGYDKTPHSLTVRKRCSAVVLVKPFLGGGQCLYLKKVFFIVI